MIKKCRINKSNCFINKNWKQIILNSVFVLSFFYFGQGFGQAKIADKIIAKIGGEILLYSDFMEQKAFIKEKHAMLSPEEECGILENILVQKFLVHKAKVDSIEIKDEEIEQQLNARIEQILQYMGNDYTKFEEEYGAPVATIKERFRDDLKSQMLTERLQQKVLGDIQVTPQEVEEFFNAIPKDSIPYFKSEVEISELVHRPNINAEEMKTAKDKLEKIRSRILAGESFEKLCQQFSEDPGSAKLGGNLGWMKRGSLVPEYEAAAYNLQKDSLSKIVETEFGLHLIQLLGRRGNSINTRHILIRPKSKETDLQQAEHYIDSIRTLVVKDSMNFEFAVRSFSDKKSEFYNSGGRLLNPKTNSYIFETSDLDPDVYFAIDGLKIDEVSKPVASTDQEGKTYYRIFKLHSRSSPHKANLKQDYSKIQTAAKEIKKNQRFQLWLLRELPKVYIFLDPDILAVCPSLENFGKSIPQPE
ncbi:MAG TPA: peptidylprolyl isomerase [Saprospiraceae bacterium]|nr:peptidylprolyl isomerase [Saprospiraceae bacterium]